MTRRDEIFEILCDYADKHRGNSPSIRDLLAEVNARGYTMAKGTLEVHLLKLFNEGRLCRVDGKLIVVNSHWERPEMENTQDRSVVRRQLTDAEFLTS